jgi:Domain of unknown function (DUF3794)
LLHNHIIDCEEFNGERVILDKFKDLISYSGLATVDEFPDCPIVYKQTSFINTIKVPEQKPDIEQVLKVMAIITIEDIRVITKPYDIKLVVSGTVKQRLVYTANVPEQSVHSFHNNIPFCELVIIPDKNLNCKNIKVKALIEDIHVFHQDLRSIQECKVVCFVVEKMD